MPEDPSKRVLARDNVIHDYVTSIRYPDNLEDLLGASGAWQGVASLLFTAGASLLATPAGWPLVIIGGPSHIAGWAGRLDPSVKQFADKLHYVEASQAARINIAVSAAALQRTSNRIDAVLQVKPTFQVDAHRADDKTSVLFQDSVSIFIRQSDADKKDWVLNTLGLAPANAISAVQYSESHTWTAEGGINVSAKDGPSGGAGGSYSFSTSSGVTVSDFDLVGSIVNTGGYVWNASMKNAYTDGTSAHRYDVKTPSDIVVNGAMTKWFKDPPEVACGAALSLPVLATFTRPAPAGASAAFEFVATQRVQYGYIAGRWGASGAKVGGYPAIVPAVAMASGTIVLDFTQGTVKIEKPAMKLSTLPEGAA